ncbi:SUKH-3 domain-containing protein, partial [Bacillus pseudomycoides]
MEISNKTIEGLKKAGWYEGRKIDISENVKFLEERGFEVFESAKKIMEEFGELRINVETIRPDGSKKISKHTTCIKEVIGVLDSS